MKEKKEKFYVSPAVKQQTMALLVDYRRKNPAARTPMADAYKATPNVTDEDKVRFVRAAHALGWSVTKHKGVFYENGVQIWQ